MPYDIHLLPGKKSYIDDGGKLLALVRETWPDAMREGACGTMSFTSGNLLVGEAWMHPRKPGWWYRIREKH